MNFRNIYSTVELDLPSGAVPVAGGTGAVGAWFREHRQIDVSPPRDADYSTPTGCTRDPAKGA